jgi:hypothetical protein
MNMALEEVTIPVETINEALQKCIPVVFEEIVNRGYGNPVKDAIEEELENNEGALKLGIAEAVRKLVKDEKFSDMLKDKLVEKMLAKGLNF